MTVHLSLGNHAAGTVKFDRSVSVGELSELTAEMKRHNPDRWIDLHIRSAGDDGTHYIAFHYILPDVKKKTYKRAVNRLIQFLRDRLGSRPKRNGKKNSVPNGVVGWSISIVDTVV